MNFKVMKVQQTIVVKCPNLAVPYRRLVCYCRLYEVQDISKKDKPGKTKYILICGGGGGFGKLIEQRLIGIYLHFFL